MDALLKALTAVMPFIGRCPTWFQVVVVVWLALTAIIAITGFALAIFEPPSTSQATPSAPVLASSSAPSPSSSAPSGASGGTSAAASQPQIGLKLLIIIIAPKTGSLVDVSDTVEFVSPYDNLNHYVIVTPLSSATRWVVDGPLRAEAGVQQYGNARFGETRAGRGERFSIQILATTSQLTAGPLERLPLDHKFSAAVIVTRAR